MDVSPIIGRERSPNQGGENRKGGHRTLWKHSQTSAHLCYRTLTEYQADRRYTCFALHFYNPHAVPSRGDDNLESLW